MNRAGILLALAAAGCDGDGGVDADQRWSIGNALVGMYASGESWIYSDIASPATATHVTGPPDHFVIEGVINNPTDSTVTAILSGEGGVVGLELADTMHVVFDGWAYDTSALYGGLDVTELATYQQGAPIPDTVDAQITAQVHMTGALAGEHSIDITLCYRNFYTGFIDPVIPQLYGWHGTVDGEDANDHYAGNDPECKLSD